MYLLLDAAAFFLVARFFATMPTENGVYISHLLIGMDNTVLVAVMFTVAILVLYVGGRYYLREGYQKQQGLQASTITNTR